MGREIKFRAWDKFNETYYYSRDYMSLSHFFLQVERCVDGGNLIVLEQFTGLSDKGGYDIYDGDVVAALCEGERDTTHLVAWDYGDNSYPAFDLVGWKGEANGFSDALEGSCYQLGLIGNIRENPELLRSLK